jgi:hypothetical protein
MSLGLDSILTSNLFLDNAPVRAMKSIVPSLTLVPLKRGKIVFEPDEPLGKILFPITSIISMVWEMSDGAIAEVGIVGREGMTGVPIALGQSSAQQRAIVQVPDSAQCLPASVFRGILDTDPEFKSSRFGTSKLPQTRVYN